MHSSQPVLLRVPLRKSDDVRILLSPIERWHRSLKGECIRPGTPLSLADVRRLVDGYVDQYNNVRLNSATGYITPKDMLALGGNRRSTRSATGSWRRRGSKGRFVASKPLDA